jgi:hypothetical protein
MRALIIIGLILWFIFGDPGRTVAGWFWEYDAAPWERVDAFYYPDRSNLEKVQQHSNVGGVPECRAWVNKMAAAKGDPYMRRGDYECGVGEPKDMYGMKVYRTTVD